MAGPVFGAGNIQLANLAWEQDMDLIVTEWEQADEGTAAVAAEKRAQDDKKNQVSPLRVPWTPPVLDSPVDKRNQSALLSYAYSFRGSSSVIFTRATSGVHVCCALGSMASMSATIASLP